jgi:hypothetical protein
MDTCGASRRDGSPCTARALPGRSRCFAHDPDLAGKRRAANAEGGRNKATARRLDKLTPASLRPLLDKYIGAVDAVEAGELEPKQAAAMAALVGVILKFYEVAEVEARLAALEAQHEQSRIR